MPKDSSISSVLIIGSGPIVIGQAAEFDYSGTQGCRALKEEGYNVILVNDNPATIMTDEINANTVYFEPLTIESLEKIIEKERPQGLLATLGGQTGLNLACSLNDKGILAKYAVKVLGTPIESIKRGEDREAFRRLMKELNEPVPESRIVHTVEEALSFINSVGFPVIVRPAYTLGGSGGGIAQTKQELVDLTTRGLAESPITQCLIERSIAGFKEIEYEVMRDQKGTCITVCNMENVDPVGIHTGDSIVVAPSQTLTDEEFQMLRRSSIRIISALGIIGGCNIQFALDPKSKQYYLIEVNPRVSRSSALASKATGYPIAKIATKLAIGYTLDEISNPVTGKTVASFEPALDYVVVKFPRFPFDKFPDVSPKLGTQMKATGEVMAMDRNFERAIQKAVHSLEGENDGLRMIRIEEKSTKELYDIVKGGHDSRFFAILELIRREEALVDIHKHSAIDQFFLQSFQVLISLEEEIKRKNMGDLTPYFMQKIKEKGFSDRAIAYLMNEKERDIRNKRKELNVIPSYKLVDTCAGEFTAQTAYYYSSYYGESELLVTNRPKVLMIGSGPIRIGQGIEFDYSSVHGIFSLQEEGYETLLINNNPETVSTDFEISDKLYFEPLTFEDVLNVIESEKVDSVVVQYGGQSSINLARELEEAGVPLLGITYDTIDQLEDRDRFYNLLNQINVPHVRGETAMNDDELFKMAKKVGYPVLLRPSYVIGGKGMVVLQDEAELQSFVVENPQKVYPLLIDSFVSGKEFEIDLLTDGHDILIPTIIEHIEKAGVHSGDSHAVLPAFSLKMEEKQKIVEYARRIVNQLKFTGIMNIQFVQNQEKIFVLEVNPRASRTVPIISKVTGIPMIQLATKCLLGKSLNNIVGVTGLLNDVPYFTVKYPVFSTNKLLGDPTVGPEMKSTGEGISMGHSIGEAFSKVFQAYWSRNKEANEFLLDIEESAVDSNLQSLIDTIEQMNCTVFYRHAFPEWMKSERALAYISLENNKMSIQRRIIANQKRIQVFTSLETVHAFLETFYHKDLPVTALNEWREQYGYRKEVSIT